MTRNVVLMFQTLIDRCPSLCTDGHSPWGCPLCPRLMVFLPGPALPSQQGTPQGSEIKENSAQDSSIIKPPQHGEPLLKSKTEVSKERHP
ncbi:hypothetical protein SKAU_G00227770 [Synaphobranchus kaupii]|uniref:Uncharacterized protein n=1 Tax=Synaphobranchus kaupii TaxID=118154 RepID=A0A9Q1F506_SYNKA|nr:hypothetical protein SKAU_G00227770 [Synaphobranchus kaupii]